MTVARSSRRSGCPISFSLDIFGDRWTLLVLRDLILFDRRHFHELAAMEEGIASNILSDRLKRLEQNGILRRDRDPADRRKVIYRVTEKGIALVPTLYEISYWGATHDSKTAAPASFVEAYPKNRKTMIAKTVARLRAE